MQCDPSQADSAPPDVVPPERFPKGRHVLITGGLGDIGKATALRLARDGHRVTVFDLPTVAEGQHAMQAWDTGGLPANSRLAYDSVDVTDVEALRRGIEGIPSLDTAIANAGTVISAPFLDITPAQWQRQFDVNVTGAFHTAQVAAQRFIRQRTAGLLLFTGSWVADVPWPEITAYACTKAALQTLARQAARELAPHKIRANVVAPGIVRAGLAKKQLDTEPQYAARAARVVPLGELQTPQQVAAAFSFLCSPDSDYMTGSTLLTDGGSSLFAFD